jgi:bleomycin hydrolase
VKRTLLLTLVFGGGCVAVSAGCRPGLGGRDRAAFVDDTNEFAARLEVRAAATRPVADGDNRYPPLLRGGVSESRPSVGRKKSVLTAVPADLDPPASPGEFRQAWHFKPVLQGLTGQCWSFGATSFFESEIYRLTRREIRLSEMYPVYWEFVEKARRFVRERGNSEFGRGSEPDALIRIWKTYGVVPASAYAAMPPGRDFYDDRQMYAQMRNYLASIRQRGEWDEEGVVTMIRAILDEHLGAPPTSIEGEGRTMTPQEYLRDVVRLDLDGYISLMSLMQEPFHQWCEYKVPDNWWHSRNYFNVPLDEFMNVIRQAASEGVSLCIGIDNTEPGFLFRQDVAFVPAFDIPSAYIDDAARQLRFGNESTTDDHVVHLVGSCRRGGWPWYLIKDSGTRPRNGHHDGYMFYREDYVRLKVMTVMLPRNAAERALGTSLK